LGPKSNIGTPTGVRTPRSSVSLKRDLDDLGLDLDLRYAGGKQVDEVLDLVHQIVPAVIDQPVGDVRRRWARGELRRSW
jgi:hypothetical protein